MTEKKPKKPGRPAYEPTDKERKQVEAFVAYGARQDDIATLMGIDPKTLRQHFRDELDHGKLRANMKVAESLYRQAVGAPAMHDAAGRVIREEQKPLLGAAIFWLKTQAGWSEFTPAKPPAPKDERPGKKAQADLDARTAEQGTGWGDLVH
jgi:hypothetical protein